MSSACVKPTTETRDMLDVVMNLLSLLQLSTADRAKIASNLRSDDYELQNEAATSSGTTDLQSESSISSDSDTNPVHVEDSQPEAAMEANLPVTTADPPSAVTDLMDDVDTEDSATEASLPVAIAAPPSSAVQPTNVVTIMDDTDHYADHVDAAIARGSVLNTHMSTYFNVPLNPNPNVKLYYITRGRKIGVFSGWNNVSPWVLGVSRAVYERVDTVEEGIEIVKFAIEDGIAARV